jgi:hypothetical protein
LPAALQRNTEISRSKSAPPIAISQPAQRSTLERLGAAFARSRTEFFARFREMPGTGAGATSTGAEVSEPMLVKLIAILKFLLSNLKKYIFIKILDFRFRLFIF